MDNLYIAGLEDDQIPDKPTDTKMQLEVKSDFCQCSVHLFVFTYIICTLKSEVPKYTVKIPVIG